jgi:hypothetical protein
MHQMAYSRMLPEKQYGSRSGIHDYFQLLRYPAPFIENNAVGCYDQLMNNLVLMLLEK